MVGVGDSNFEGLLFEFIFDCRQLVFCQLLKLLLLLFNQGDLVLEPGIDGSKFFLELFLTLLAFSHSSVQVGGKILLGL